MKLKKTVLLAATALCMSLSLAAVACGETDKNNNVDIHEQTAQGSVLVVETGVPEANLGDKGDICLVTQSGDLYRKEGSEWVKVEIEGYNVEGNNLTVTYHGGDTGVYQILQAEANGTCDHANLNRKDIQRVYGEKCVVPGIGVSTCPDCHASFVEIIPADGKTHDYNAENFGKCSYCGNLESGKPGFSLEAEGSGEDAEIPQEQFEKAFEQLEDGDTIELGGDLTITDATTLAASDKDVTFDVKGHDVAVEKRNVNSTGICLSGGSLTITDSTATEPDSEARGKFTLDVTEANNMSSRDEGTYAMRLDDMDLKITNVDFEIVNSTKNHSHAMYVTGGKIDVESDAKITMIQGKDETGKQTCGGYGMFISEGAEMNLKGAQVKSEGPIFPFVVGNNATSEEKSILNIEAGTVINYHNSARSYGVVEVYTKGVVNMEEGSKIVVDGASIDPDLPTESAGSNAMAFTVIGGGEVNFNGEIDLGLTRGMAYAFFILNNTFWYDNPDADLPSHIALDAHCTIGNTAKINGSSEEGGIMLFAAQRNGKQALIYHPESKSFSLGELTLAEEKDRCSLVIEKGAQITINNEVVNKSSYGFAFTDSAYRGAGAQGDRLDYFTSDAINDLRTFGE